MCWPPGCVKTAPAFQLPASGPALNGVRSRSYNMIVAHSNEPRFYSVETRRAVSRLNVGASTAPGGTKP